MGNFDPYISFIHSIILTTIVNVTGLHFTCMAAGPAAKLSEFSLCCCSLHAKMTKKVRKETVPIKKTCTDSAVNHRCWCTRVVSFPVSFPVFPVFWSRGAWGRRLVLALFPGHAQLSMNCTCGESLGTRLSLHYGVFTSSVLTFNTLLCWSLWVCNSLILCWYFCRSFWGEATVITFLTSIYGESQTFYLLVSVIKISVPICPHSQALPAHEWNFRTVLQATESWVRPGNEASISRTLV